MATFFPSNLYEYSKEIMGALKPNVNMVDKSEKIVLFSIYLKYFGKILELLHSLDMKVFLVV